MCWQRKGGACERLGPSGCNLGEFAIIFDVVKLAIIRDKQ